MADNKNFPPLLQRTPFVGSGFNRVIHKTDVNCRFAVQIPPDERWYIKAIPEDGNYSLCPYCFPEARTEEDDVIDETEEEPSGKPRSLFPKIFKRKEGEENSEVSPDAVSEKEKVVSDETDSDAVVIPSVEKKKAVPAKKSVSKKKPEAKKPAAAKKTAQAKKSPASGVKKAAAKKSVPSVKAAAKKTQTAKKPAAKKSVSAKKASPAKKKK